MSKGARWDKWDYEQYLVNQDKKPKVSPRLSIKERRRRFLISTPEPENEYQLQKITSKYLNFYPDSLYQIDFAGSNLSKAQAGKLKAVNKYRGWPDTTVYNQVGPYIGLVIELKILGTQLIKKKDSKVFAKIGEKRVRGEIIPIREKKIRKAGDWTKLHIEEQAAIHELLIKQGWAAGFGVGLEKVLKIIDGYFNKDEILLDEGFRIEK